MKVLRKIYIVVFIGACFSLFLLMPFSHSDMTAEKREAAQLPSIKTEDGKLNMDYFDELTSYFSDNFAFRQELATTDARIKSTVFHTSNQEKVVVGKNGWLYFNGSLDDYFGRNLLNKREIYAASKTVALMQEYAESKGARFIFTVAPNKNTLYPENMPDNYLAATGDTNIECLGEQLAETKVRGYVSVQTGGRPEVTSELPVEQSINYVDLQTEFLAQDKILYHKWDSHWNNEGAAFACDKLLSSIDKSHYDYSNEPYTVEADHSGDVWQLIYPSWRCLDENVEYEKMHTYTYLNPVDSVEDMFIVTSCPEGEGSVVMFRDSFGNALLPYIADEYEKGLFMKGMPLNVKQVEQQQADTLIFEIVERNIPNIIAYLPVMDAPERHLEEEDIIDVSEKLRETVLEYEDKVSQVVIYGELNPEFVNTDTDVFLEVITPDGTFNYYEATPAAYIKPDEGADMSYYYGAYLNKDLAPEGSEVRVVYGTDDEFYGAKKIVLSYN